MKTLTGFKLTVAVLLFLLLGTAPLYYQLIRPGFFPMQDDLQAFRLQQMIKCIQDLQIPCRWIPDMGYQYGYPEFNFYPPSVFYIASIFYFSGLQIIDTVKLMFILGFILSSCAMFIFLKSWLVNTGSNNWKDYLPVLAGALLYNWAPFKASQVYVRGSLNEFWCFPIFPMIFWASLGLIKTKKIKYIAWLAIFTALLLLTHNLMSLIFFPIAGIWMLSLLILEKSWLSLPKLIIAVVLGFMLASFFTIPVIFEGQYVHLDTLTSGYFDYRQHFVSLYKLFISNHFGYGSSGIGQDNDITVSTGQVHWILALIAVFLALSGFKKHRKLSSMIFILGLSDIIVLFLVHQKSSFIWENITVLKYLQFPWRFLEISVFLLSILDSAAIYLVYQKSKKAALVLALAAFLIVFILHGNFFKPRQWLNISDKDKFSGNYWERQLTISIFDYLPIYAQLPPNHKAQTLPEILDGQAKFVDYKKQSDIQSGKIEVYSVVTIRLPLFDFPGMEVTIDGKKVAYTHNDCRYEDFCLGLITFNVPQGMHNLKAQLTNTPIRTSGNIITIISIFLTSFLFFLSKKYEKKLA